MENAIPEFPGFSTSNFCKQLIFHLNMLFVSEHDCPFAQCFRSDLFGSQAGNTYPFRSLKDRLSPSCSPSMGSPLLQQTSLMDNRVPQKSGNSAERDIWSWRCCSDFRSFHPGGPHCSKPSSSRYSPIVAPWHSMEETGSSCLEIEEICKIGVNDTNQFLGIDFPDCRHCLNDSGNIGRLILIRRLQVKGHVR